MNWNPAEAKNRFSEVVNRALTEGPQWVHLGEDAVVIVSAEEFERLSSRQPTFKEYLAPAESFEGLDLERDQSPSRDVSLLGRD